VKGSNGNTEVNSLNEPAQVAPAARRRSLIALGVAVLVTGLIGVILFAHSGPTSTSSAVGGIIVGSSPTASGISSQNAQLLDLDVLPDSQATPAPEFSLVDQRNRATSLDQLRGKVVVWSLNDDQCTDLCALFAQDVVAADRDLGRAAKNVVFLSVNANPYYPSTRSVRSWSVRNDLESLPNWEYVTGTPAQLAAVWKAYQVSVILDPHDRTVEHDTTIYFINPAGKTRAIGDFANGSLDTAYYAHTLAQMADDLLPPNERVAVGGPNVNTPTTEGATIGSRAPTFSLPILGAGGRAASLASFAGTMLVLNFWSSTCTICLQEMPALQQVSSDFGHKIEVVGVDVADPRNSPLSFARRLGVRYPLLADHNGGTAAGYRVDALPVTFLISSNGTILARHPGALTVPELEAVLEMDDASLP
jgi:cytochrome oxidase Cu insertion factor (SCO1/SenC/PrrC family)/thiol-disulfide isomerase/thioredoxin